MTVCCKVMLVHDVWLYKYMSADPQKLGVHKLSNFTLYESLVNYIQVVQCEL